MANNSARFSNDRFYRAIAREASGLDGIIRDLVDVFLRDLCGDFTAVKKVNLNDIKEEPWQSPAG